MDSMVKDFMEFMKKAKLVQKLFLRLGNNDSIAVMVVKDARIGEMIAEFASGMKEKSPQQGIWERLFGRKTSPPPKIRLIDSVYVVMAFQDGNVETINGKRVVETSEGKQQINKNWESLEHKPGPMVLLIPQDTVRYVQNHPSIWNRVTIRNGL